ncbi:MAG: Flp family type IVb pilin [Planctomycetota bacterium]|nr:Flp family type IVb pilin [Planctomycetota bacterium]
MAKKFLADEKAAEVTELAIIFALIVAASIALISSLGSAVQTFYEDTRDALTQ